MEPGFCCCTAWRSCCRGAKGFQIRPTNPSHTSARRNPSLTYLQGNLYAVGDCLSIRNKQTNKQRVLSARHRMGVKQAGLKVGRPINHIEVPNQEVIPVRKGLAPARGAKGVTLYVRRPS